MLKSQIPNPKSQRKVKLSVTDRMLLDEIQRRFPLCARPYAKLGERLNLSEAAVLRRLRMYKANNLIRRIGPMFDARANRLTSVLIALSVPPSRVRHAVECINSCEGVTHNYLRRHPLNIWFTLSGRDRAAQESILRKIKKKVSPLRYLELPSKKVFKLAVIFDLGLPAGRRVRAERGGYSHRARMRCGRAPVGRSLMGKLAPDLPLVSRPFPRGALKAIRVLTASGRIRRFGAILDGRRLGFRFNALVAWRADPGRIKEAGRRLASFPPVSHCYARVRSRSWPYDLYTMVHVRDRMRGRELVADMARTAGIADYAVLETVRELKRSSVAPPMW